MGKKITDDTEIQNIFQNDMKLLINERVFDLKPTTTTLDINGDDRKLQLSSLIQKMKFFKIRERLEELQTVSIPYEEYLKICSDNGVDEIEARLLSRSFHKAAIFLHFFDDDNLKHQLFLKPEEFIELVYDNYQASSPILVFLGEQIAYYKEREKQLQTQLAPALALKQTLETQADAAVRKGAWGLSASFAGGYALYWHLTYEKLSWDIMEPTAFFTGLGFSIIAYCWWMFTHREYEYQNFYSYFFSRSIENRFKKLGLSLDSYRTYQSQLHDVQAKLSQLERHSNRLQLFRLSKSNLNSESSSSTLKDDNTVLH